MKKFIIQVAFLLAAAALAMYFFITPQTPEVPFIPQPLEVRQLEINGVRLSVEIADTKEKRSKGLSGRESMATDSGMLFIFTEVSRHSFWMKGLTFSLDFVWIKGDRVAGVLENAPVPSPGQPDSSLPIYEPSIDVDKVLEVNAGVVKRLNIKVGDIVKII